MGKRLFSLIIMIIIFLLSGCASTQQDINKSNPEEKPKYGGTYRFPLTNDPVSLDPAYITDGLESAVASNIFLGLVQFNEKLEVEPALAESWERSEDGLTWTFKLKKGVHFHNGKELSADDVIYTFERLLNPEVDSPRKNLFMFIQGAEQYNCKEASNISGLYAPDKYTVVIKLTAPLTPFLSILATPNAGIIPAGAAETGDFGHHPVGAGPFLLKRWERGKEILLVRNENYFGERPYLDEILFKIILDPERLLAQFEAGNLDEAVLPISAEEQKRWTERSGIKFIEQPVWGVEYIGMNMTIPPLDNRLVRQAMNYAVDWSAIMDESTIRAKGIIPPNMPGHNKDIKSYEFNLEKARRLLNEAGYPNGIDREIELWVNNDAGARMVGEFVRAQLAQIGIKIKLGMMDWNDLTEAADRGELSMFLIGWVADYPDPDTFLYPLFYSKNKGKGGNNTFYSNPAVDKLLLKARNMDMGEARNKVYAEAEKMIVEDAPWIFMYHYTTTVAFQPWVHGRVITGMGESSLPLTKVWIE